MDIFQVGFICSTLFLVGAQKHHPVYEVEEHHEENPKYQFKYGVSDLHTHDIKEQQEKSDGHKVEGYYKFLEADGTTRTVHYTADKHSGFNAHVERKGLGTHLTHGKNVISPIISHHDPSNKAFSFSNSHLY